MDAAGPLVLPAPPEAWAGFECTRVRVGRRRVDQLELTGHDRRHGDLDALTWLGVTAVRYPVLWERVAPDGLARADWGWVDARLEALRAAGIRPVVGLLHHGGGPRGMSLLHPGFPAAFGRYAGAVARRYPWVRDWLPINEPLTTARFAGLYGVWHPHARSEAVFGRLVLAQVLAIRAAMDAIREVRSDARLIVNEDVGRTSATDDLAGAAAFYNERRWLSWDLLLGRVRPDHPLYGGLAVDAPTRDALASLVDRPSAPDLLGVDHYVTSDRWLDHRLDAYPEHLRPADPRTRFVDVEAVRVADVPFGGIEGALRDTWDRYGRRMVLAEVALAGEPADQVAWWREAWEAATASCVAGHPVEAVTAWAVMGATGWDALLRGRRLRYEPGVFDARFDPPAPRPWAHAVRAAALEWRRARERDGRHADGADPSDRRRRHAMQAATASLPGRARPGWWRREDRVVHDPA